MNKKVKTGLETAFNTPRDRLMIHTRDPKKGVSVDGLSLITKFVTAWRAGGADACVNY